MRSAYLQGTYMVVIYVILRRFELGEEFEFVHDTLDWFLGHNPCFGHLFHGINFSFFFFAFDSPDLTEAASADRILELKVVLWDG